ncbi:MAG: NAD-dependent malic enzyme [Verrucomicrobiales bacterium]|nr:NAD-dependent malic enzyme [Verrucomicrobiales bacterium]MCP5526865.1 NAD-dependent malic enzyme [Verrucomicrobiales bacterium]
MNLTAATLEEPGSTGRHSATESLPPSTPVLPHGIRILQNPAYNKGTAFTEAEREALGLHGLLPPQVFTPAEQVMRVMANYRRKASDIERYIHLISLLDRNETLFYRVVTEHIEEMLPIIYTPTVGQACQEYSTLFRRPRGFYISARDRGRIDAMLANWPWPDVRVIVVTDGERILGLGDLGAQGMGIPVGKLALYTVCAGVHPHFCLPVLLDVGTNNEALLRDPLYTGLRQPRLRGGAYRELVDEFVTAVQRRFPGALLQFEDFANANAFALLEACRDRVCTFNDDIQGTAAVALAGIHAALRLTGGNLTDQTLLLCGAGEAGLGIARLAVAALQDAGLEPDTARARCWLFDSKGLVVQARQDLSHAKRAFAHERPLCSGLTSAVETVRPTVLIGAAGVPRLFSQSVITEMARLNARPVVFALSNPTSKSECTAEEAYGWSEGRAVFASGSPFPAVTLGSRTWVPGQANNAYVFPGVGLGVIASQAARVTDAMFHAAARALAAEVGEIDIEQGRVFPALRRIREVSLAIAVAVAEEAYRAGLARVPCPADWRQHIAALMYEPTYPSYV